MSTPSPRCASSADRDLRRSAWSRRWLWDLPGRLGPVALLGHPGLGLLGRGITQALFSVSFAGPAVGHAVNVRRSRRRRSASSALVYGAGALLMATAVVVHLEPVSLDVVWIVAFVVWGFWSAHDRSMPARTYR